MCVGVVCVALVHILCVRAFEEEEKGGRGKRKTTKGQETERMEINVW